MPQSPDDIRTAYDKAAGAYAELFRDELSHKPLDIHLLKHFALFVGAGQPVLDLGCGPGHTTAYLHSLGLDAVGIDLSSAMVAKATGLFPHVDFAVGDFFKLPEHDHSVTGVLAFYCIVHLQRHELVPAFREMCRVLQPGGLLLVSFHVGSEVVVQDDFLNSGARLEFFAFAVGEIESALREAGLTNLEIHERPPYDTEYPTTRCYIFARKPTEA